MASPYLSLADDGTDLGANMATLATFTSVAASGDRRGVTETRYSAGWFTYNGTNLAQYPRTVMNTDTFPTRTGVVRSVNSDATFSAALTAAVPGDWIVVDHTVTYTGNYYGAFPVKNGDAAPGGNNVIVVISKALYDGYSSGVFSVCPQKKRVAVTDLANLAYFKCTNNTLGAFMVSGATKGWRFVGLRFGVDAGTSSVSHLVSLGNGDNAAQSDVSQCPSNLGLDRCWIDAHSGCEVRHAVELHCQYGFVIDCGYGDDIHVTTYSESHAIVGYNGPGPFRIVNNRVCGGSQFLFFGGAASLCGMPADIEVRYNTFTRPASWIGGPYKVKCGFEIKKAQFVLFEGNILENVWPQSQAGAGLLLKSESYGDGATIGYTADVLARANLIRNVAFGVNIASLDNVDPAYPANRVISFGNLYRVGAAGFDASQNPFIGMYLSTNSGTVHDTFISEGTVNAIGQPTNPTGFRIMNTIFGPTNYGLKGSAGGAEGTYAITNYMPGAIVTKTIFTGRSSGSYPVGNYFPADDATIQYTNATTKDYSLLGTTQVAGAGGGGTGGGGGTVTPTATALRIVTQPAGSTSGVALTTQPAVEVIDQFGVRIASTATITATSDSGAVTETGNTKAAVAGLATFTALTPTNSGSTVSTTFTFTSAGLTSVTSSAVSVVTTVAGPVATALQIVTQPAGSTSAVPLITQPVVRVIDQYGNPITSTATVTASVVTTGPVTLVAGTTVVCVAGVATFTALTANTPSEYHAAVQFSSPGLTSVISNYFVVAIFVAPPPPPTPQPVPEPPTPPTTDPVPAALVLTRDPGPVSRLTSGRKWPQQPIVEARDSAGALMTTFAGSVTVSIAAGNGVLHGTVTVRAIGGTARWTDLSIVGSGPQTLAFTDGPYTGTV